MRSALRFASLLVAAAPVLPAPVTARTLFAQEAPATAPASGGGIRGSVIDAQTAAGLGGSIVTLIPRDGTGAFPPAAGEARFSNARTTATTPAGSYAFSDVGTGAYTILVHRGGYEPARVEVEIGAAGEARVSIGLVVQPVRLQAVKVEAARPVATSPVSEAAADSSGRIRAALERQKLFLSTDARDMTSADMHEALTLGSADLLLAMQRLPGVTHANEQSATLWVRGSRWDHTRVYFDGVPLFQPLSALGALSGVNPSAIGTAFLLPGVRPTSLGGDGLARIELRTSPGTPDGKLRGTGELSLWGAVGALGYRREDDAAGIQLTARQGLNDVFQTEEIPAAFGTTSQAASFRYDEATARADAAVGNGRLEFSGIYSRDELVPPYTGYVGRQDWTTRAGRVTYSLPVRTLTLSQTIVGTTFDGHLLQPLFRTSYTEPESWQSRSLDNDVAHLAVSTRLGTPVDGTGGWSTGMDAVWLRAGFRGIRQHLIWGDSSSADTTGRDATRYVSLWAERRWSPAERLMIETGARADAGGAGLAAVRPAFSAQARWAFDELTTVSVGAGRSHHYQQQIPTPSRAGWLPTPQPWTVAGETAPLLTSDVATAGIERWHGEGVLLGAGVFIRRSGGVVVRDPRPGPITPGAWFKTGRESAHGLEASARKLTGRFTGMLAYSYQQATTNAGGMRFASEASIPHALDAAASVRLGAWRIGVGHTLTSGAAVTAVINQPRIVRDSVSGEYVFDGWDYEAGQPAARRMPLFSRLDLFTDWTRGYGRSRFTVYGGLRTVFPAGKRSWDFDLTCSGSLVECAEQWPLRRSGMVSPTLGLRLTF